MNFVITHLDGTKIRIKNEPGEVIKPDDLKTVPEKGLPFYKQPYKFGNMFVMFKVTFPDKMAIDKIPAIKGALPGPAAETDAAMDAETCMLSNFEESQRNTKAGGGTRDDSEDEEEEGHGGPGAGQRVQCAQQ